MTKPKELRDWIPHQAIDSLDKKVADLLAWNVVMEFDARDIPWIGPRKNVTHWCVIESGSSHKAVGFNENVAVGWSFPVRAVNRHLFANLQSCPEYVATWLAARKRKAAK